MTELLTQELRTQETRTPDEALSTRKELVIEPKKGLINVNWVEMWEYRELLYFLIWRDVKVRYKQTSLGVAWAVLQPLLSMFIFTIIFGHLAKMPSDSMPYQVFVYAGLLPWTFFSNAVTKSGQSLIGQQALLTKVYFPRLFMPVSAVLTGLVDMGVSFILYGLILLYYRTPLTVNILALPALVLLTTINALGVGIALSALTVKYRDFRHVIPFMVQIWMYGSPVVYSVNLVPSKYQWLLAMNPLAGIIDGYRASILGKPWNVETLVFSVVVSCLMLAVSLIYFRKVERQFADIA